MAFCSIFAVEKQLILPKRAITIGKIVTFAVLLIFEVSPHIWGLRRGM
jgi:hypothetical protein